MVALAGGFAGLLMALIFIGHMAVALVFGTPKTFHRRFSEPGSTLLPRILVFGAIAAVPFWTLLGIAAAILFSIAEDQFPTDSGAVPSAIYLGIIAAFALVTAPLPLLLIRYIRVHIAAEYVIFVLIYGLMIPWIAGSG